MPARQRCLPAANGRRWCAEVEQGVQGAVQGLDTLALLSGERLMEPRNSPAMQEEVFPSGNALVKAYRKSGRTARAKTSQGGSSLGRSGAASLGQSAPVFGR